MNEKNENVKILGKQIAKEALRESSQDIVRAIRLLEYFHIHYRNLAMEIKSLPPNFSKLEKGKEIEIIDEGIEQLHIVMSMSSLFM